MHCKVTLAGLLLGAVAAPVAQCASESPFGEMSDGRPVFQYTLRNRVGTEAQVLSLGATLRAVYLTDRSGKRLDVVLGYDTLKEYEAGRAYFGATIGRYANRIANAQLTIADKTYPLEANNGPHTLHGGQRGFNRALWVREGGTADNSVRLKYVSPDGEEGFPGKLTVWVTYTLTAANELKISYEAKTSATTVVNLTNHSYFNLGGAGIGDISAERLSVQADAYTPVDEQGIPTGDVVSIDGTDFDLRALTTLGSRLQSARDPRVVKDRTFDQNWVLRDVGHGLRPVARLQDPATGLALDVLTTEPGLQLFTPRFPAGRLIGKGGRDYGGLAAVCLETQHFPDSPHHRNFPSTLLEPGHVFRSQTVYRFSLFGAALNAH